MGAKLAVLLDTFPWIIGLQNKEQIFGNVKTCSSEFYML